jgi:hypothetical protein
MTGASAAAHLIEKIARCYAELDASSLKPVL